MKALPLFLSTILLTELLFLMQELELQSDNMYLRAKVRMNLTFSFSRNIIYRMYAAGLRFCLLGTVLRSGIGRF